MSTTTLRLPFGMEERDLERVFWIWLVVADAPGSKRAGVFDDLLEGVGERFDFAFREVS